MQVRMLKLFAGIVAGILIVAALAGCSGSSAPEIVNEEPSFAGAITESILLAFNTGDYTAFSKRFDVAMKKAMPEATFIQTRDLIRGKVGDYKAGSKYYVDHHDADEIYTVVVYKGEYTKEDEVKIIITFLETDDYIYVSGLYFDSPNLR